MTLFFADTHVGHRRIHNEDCYAASPESGLWLVADGIGGHADGEVAAAIVRDILVSDIAAGEPLIDAIHHSHRAILEEIDARQNCNMGSTVVALQISGVNYEIAWVGDSRAYLFDGDLKQVSQDHNPVSELLAQGALTPEQAAVHPERNVLSQSLGVSGAIDVRPGRARGKVGPGQQLLLCSDGLTDELSDQQVSQIMAREQSPEAQAKALITGALAAGGRDNITVVVVGDKGTGGTGTRARHSKALIFYGVVGVLVVIWAALKTFQ